MSRSAARGEFFFYTGHIYEVVACIQDNYMRLLYFTLPHNETLGFVTHMRHELSLGGIRLRPGQDRGGGGGGGGAGTKMHTSVFYVRILGPTFIMPLVVCICLHFGAPGPGHWWCRYVKMLPLHRYSSFTPDMCISVMYF